MLAHARLPFPALRLHHMVTRRASWLSSSERFIISSRSMLAHARLPFSALRQHYKVTRRASWLSSSERFFISSLWLSAMVPGPAEIVVKHGCLSAGNVNHER
eukprot:950989-Pleurochrysis_carterae.AAC.2